MGGTETGEHSEFQRAQTLWNIFSIMDNMLLSLKNKAMATYASLNVTFSFVPLSNSPCMKQLWVHIQYF